MCRPRASAETTLQTYIMSKYVIALVAFFLPCLNVFAQTETITYKKIATIDKETGEEQPITFSNTSDWMQVSFILSEDEKVINQLIVRKGKGQNGNITWDNDTSAFNRSLLTLGTESGHLIICKTEFKCTSFTISNGDFLVDTEEIVYEHNTNRIYYSESQSQSSADIQYVYEAVSR